MREVEFLPEWYPKVRKRKRMVALQAWMTFTLVVGLGLWTLLVQRNVYARQQQLGSLQTDLHRSEEEVDQLDHALALQKVLSGKDEILGRIGNPVQMSKVMTTLEQLMPPDMALLELGLDTEEATRPSGNTLAARAAAEKSPDTKLHFTLHGVAPTDVDLAELIANLTSRPFFKQVELGFSREKLEGGHVMREFEVHFALDIGAPGGQTIAASTPAKKKGHT